MQRIGYIGGTSFSGSTMLTLLLAMHPDVYSMGQAGPIRAVREKGGRQFCSCGERLDECPLLRGIGDSDG
ncbi:MAG: hypothetical protein U5R31_02920 [Acidimicrobiia bacterium]|nr:hypothetical protein [Acidimicrobiia bacterium]